MHEDGENRATPDSGTTDDINIAEVTSGEEEVLETPPPPPRPDRPVLEADRIYSLDVLRGVAVLGIFLVNIQTFNLPTPAFMNPNLEGFDQGADAFAYAVVYLFALSKTMPIFSMLFGAGIVLFTQRVEAREGRSGQRWFSRQAWLWVIGLLHGYLLWNGDILLPYALVGLTLYMFRKRKSRTLFILAIILFLIPKAGMFGAGEAMKYVRTEAMEAQELQEAGEELTDKQERFLEIWTGNNSSWNPSREEIEEKNEVMRGGYFGIFKHAGSELLIMHLAMYPLMVNWAIAAYMVLGMALFKTGVLQAGRSDRFYVVMLAVCYGLGLPGSWFSMGYLGDSFSNLIQITQRAMPLHDLTGVLVALGHIALVVLAVRRGWLGRLERRLAAAGRMAFTNYLSQTVIGVILFYGYGFGLWGNVSRIALLGFVLAVWIVQLAWSPWWMARFRFGPAEWLWRSLTYGKRQLMRRSDPPPASI